jgi:hypothetical protein
MIRRDWKDLDEKNNFADLTKDRSSLQDCGAQAPGTPAAQTGTDRSQPTAAGVLLVLPTMQAALSKLEGE